MKIQSLFTLAFLACPYKANNLQTCESDSNLFELSGVHMAPYPLKGGRDVKITVKGVLKRALVAGAYFTVRAKWGFVPIYYEKFDFCDTTRKHGPHCPVHPGKVEFVIEQPMSPMTPTTTNVNLKIEVFDKIGKELVCLEGKVATENK